MAKKPPQPPKPPFDDFDPDRDLNDEIVPLDEELVVESVDDDLFGNVIADEGEGTTQLGRAGDADNLPEVEISDDEIVVEADDDLFGNVVAEEGGEATKLVHDPKDIELPEVEVDEVLAEVEADDALVEADETDAFGDDDFAPSDKGVVTVDDEGFSPHEAETMASMPALDPDDPFADVGPGEEGELVAVGGGGDDAVVAEEQYYEEEAPTPKTHWFTWTLIGLNIVAALVAPYMIVLDYHKRQQYTYNVFLLDLTMLGLPSEEEETALPASKVVLPGYRLSPEEIKNIVGKRVGAIGDKFEGFDGQIIRRIPPSMLDKDILAEHFARSETYAGGPSVATVEAEVRRLQPLIVPDMKTAAEESFKSLQSDAAKRTKIEKMLHPLAMDTFQSEALAKTIKAAQGAELEKLYVDAAMRRMAFDFLLPLELFRPGETKGMFVETFGDLEKLPLDKVLDRVNDRVKSTIDANYTPAIHLGDEWGSIKRDTIEKRLTISFTMLSLAHVKKPDGELLFPNLLERIPVVMGQYDFAVACELFPSRLMNINQLVLDRISVDREGFQVPDKAGALARGKAFIDYYEDELQRIRFVQNDIFIAKIRLADLQDQQKRDAKLLEDRKEQREDVMKRIAVARAKTAKEMAELRVYQNELFRYEIGLANSEDTLTDIHGEIREKIGQKGGKQP